MRLVLPFLKLRKALVDLGHGVAVHQESARAEEPRLFGSCCAPGLWKYPSNHWMELKHTSE